MALRDLPYIPLNVKDFLTDEKLNECSPEATGVYIKLICIMHKFEPYGTILLKQKDKQNDDQVMNFAEKISNHLSFKLKAIYSGLVELIAQDVLQIDGDALFQKRMVRDAQISDIRSGVGRIGGKSTQSNNAPKKVVTKVKKEFDMSFVEPDYLPAWQAWIKHKKEKRQNYASEDTLKIAYNKLLKCSQNDPKKALLLIIDAVGNNYAGFFPYKPQMDNTEAKGKAEKIISQNERLKQRFSFENKS